MPQRKRAKPDKQWLPDVIRAFQAHDGCARLKDQINPWIKLHRQNLPDSWKETIRATIYHHSSHSSAYIPDNPDVFCKQAHGLWALRQPSEMVWSKGSAANGFISQALTAMTQEQLADYSGNWIGLRTHLREMAAVKMKKFGIPIPKDEDWPI